MRIVVASIGLLTVLAFAEDTSAQQPYPPQPAAPGQPVAPAPAQPVAPAPAPAQPAAPAAAPPAAPQPGMDMPAPQQPPMAAEPPVPGQAAVGAEFSADAQSGLEAGAEGSAEGEPLTAEQEADIERAWRRRSLKIQNAMSGSTGLLRVTEAGSGAVGTFRVSLLGSYLSTTGFLCDGSEDSCPNPEGGEPRQDEVSKMAARLGLSATLFSFMEMYMGMHTHATSNSQGDPELLQVLGDTDLGLKVFMPRPPESIFSVGGELELWLLNGTGGVGLNGAGTSFALRLLGTLDPSNRVDEEEAVPIKAHANLGYLFDNSGRLVEDTEAARGDQPISRIERFGLDISRVDSFQVGLGLEGTFDVIHPFLEWSIDVPVQRQDYTCNLSRRNPPDDQCLGEHGEFGYTPSRLGLGARIFPGIDGLALLAGFEIATGASSKFLEEVTPEPPWNLYFGLSFAADTVPPPPVIERVEEAEPPPPPPPQRYISGLVVDQESQEPIADALVRYEGQSYTGMITNPDGTFLTVNLPPGTYSFNVSAEGYKDGQCAATLPVAANAAAPAPPAAPQEPFGVPAQPAPPAAPAGAPPPPQEMPPAAPPPEPGYVTRAGLILAQAVPAPAPVAPPAPAVPAQPAPAAAPPPAAQPPAAPQPAAPPTPPAGLEQQPLEQPPMAATDTPISSAQQDVVVQLRCELEALPKVGNVVGTAVDAQTGAPVSGAKIRITDRLGRFLELNADASGAFRFENVPPGMVKLQVDAEGFLPSVTQIEVEPRKDVRATLSVNRQPEVPNVVVTRRELKLKKRVHFQHNSAEILPDSMAILQEAADVLRRHPEIARLEVQGHTDNTGTPAYNKRLSQERAEAVREALVELGVEESRLDATGYGQERPLAPNTSDANRARNRRVQLIIKERS